MMTTKNFVKGVKVTCKNEKTAVFVDNAKQAAEFMRVHEVEQGHTAYELYSTEKVETKAVESDAASE